MSPDAFTRECAAFGWADPVATEYPPDDQPAMHAHDFDATVLVLEGELQMTFEDRFEVLAPGEKCVVAAGTQHSEQTGAAGARGLLATRANRTAAAGGGPKAAEGSTVDGATVEEVSEAYDGVAELYAELFLNQLDHVEIDRNLIRSFADRVGPGARVLDAGCGPGHVTAHLDHLGLDAVGVDSAAAMIGIGQREFPSCTFEVGDLRALSFADASFHGVMSRYSIIHLALADLPVVFQELARVLKPGGTLLIWFNGTDDPSEHGEHFDHTVATAFRHDPDILSGLLAQAGLTEQSRDLRKPGEGERPFPQFAITATKVRRR